MQRGVFNKWQSQGLIPNLAPGATCVGGDQSAQGIKDATFSFNFTNIEENGFVNGMKNKYKNKINFMNRVEEVLDILEANFAKWCKLDMNCSRNACFTMKILIRSDLCGFVVGRSGDTIKRIKVLNE